MAYDHAAVNHEAGEYVRGDAQTNTIEHLWSVLKRALYGTYTSVEPFHPFRYLDERAFSYDEHHRDD